MYVHGGFEHETPNIPIDAIAKIDASKLFVNHQNLAGKIYPKQGDFVTAHYTGKTVPDVGLGFVFDSSRGGEPLEFQIGVGQVIKGWDEGVVQMSLGQRALLKIPSDKGYGSRGAGSAIPPDSNLIFDVELHRIERDGGSGETLSAPGFS